MKCVSDQELRRFLLEDLDPDRAAAVRNHLSRCVECGLAHEEMTLMLSRLRADGDEFDDPTLTRDVMRLIRIGAETIGAQAAREQPNAMVIGGTKIDTMTAAGAESWAQTLRLLWRKKASSTFAVSAAAALAAIVAISGVSAVFAVLVLAPKTHHDDEAFQTRGSTASADRWVSIQIFRKLEPQTFVPTSDVVASNDALAFAYTNRAPSKYRYLMIFGVDAHGEIYWYYPSNSDSGAEQTSIPIANTKASTTLPDEVRHALPPGKLRVFALFSEAPLSIGWMEKSVEALFRSGAHIEDLVHLPLPETGQHSRLLNVIPADHPADSAN